MRGEGCSGNGRHVPLLFTNIRSGLRHKDDLSSVIDSCVANIVVLKDTWLSSSVRNYGLFCCEERFNIYRCDRGEI